MPVKPAARPDRNARRTLAALGALAALAAPNGGSAQTAPPVTFPSGLDRPVLLGWLKQATDIKPDDVVAVSPMALIAIEQSRAMVEPEGFELIVRAEVLDRDFATREHLLSWRATIKLACRDHTASLGEVIGHDARNLAGPSRPIRATGEGWRPTVAGTVQGAIWSARCDKAYRPPLAPPEADTPLLTAERVPKPAPVKAVEPAPVPTPLAAVSEPLAPPRAVTPKPPSALLSRAGPSVQVLSTSDPAEAKRALVSLKARHPDLMAGLQGEIVAFQDGAIRRHRVVVLGFRAPGEASKFCQAFQAAGGKCFVRNDAGRSAGER